MGFKLWLMKSQRLDHTQTNLFPLPTKGICVHLLSRDFLHYLCAMPPLLKAPSLGQGPFGDVRGGAFSSASSGHLLPPLHSVARGQRSLSHLVGHPGPQDPQANDIITIVSNILLPRKDSSKKRNSSIVHSVLAPTRERNSAA